MKAAWVVVLIGLCVLAWWLSSRPGVGIAPSAPEPVADKAAPELPQLTEAARASDRAVDRELQQVAAHSTTASAPVLTVRAAIEDVIRQDPMGTERYQPASAGLDIGSLTADVRFNPHGHTLSPEQQQALAKVIIDADTERKALLRENGALTKAALGRAIEADRIESIEVVVPGPSMTAEAADRENAARRELLARRMANLGEYMKDWACTLCVTHLPDGVPRRSLVYYTRAQEPAVFEVRERFQKAETARDERIRSFFADLPR